MKLSEVLGKHYVMPYATTAIVGWSLDEETGQLFVSWEDEEAQEYLVEIEDQDIELWPEVSGGFVVRDYDGVTLGFIALDTVDLKGEL